MEFHLPGHIRTFKEFLTHLGIITLGILIALGLEQIVEAPHRAKLGKEAVAAFRLELADNRREVEEMLAAMPDLRKQIQEQVASLSDSQISKGATALPVKYPGIHFNFISGASWDTAIATQTLHEIPYEQAKRYNEAYGVLRIFLDEERAGLVAWQDMRTFGSDAARLTPDERRALIGQLRRYESFTHVIDMFGKPRCRLVIRRLNDFQRCGQGC